MTSQPLRREGDGDVSSFNAPTYDIDKPTGQCTFTGRVLEPGESYIATLVDLPEDAPEREGPSAAARLGLLRLDVAMEAWQQGKRPDNLFGHWKSTVPTPNAKKKLFVDDDVLMNMFVRLADTDQPRRLAFRFVVALILMRKKLLKYESSRQESQGDDKVKVEIWSMTPKGATEPYEVINPNLDEEQIQEVTEQLSEILESEW